MNSNTLMETLSIKFTEVGTDFLKATMPVNASTHQPMGLLHGGASAALIESIGSLGSALCVDLEKEAIVGLEINANHIKGVKSGMVHAKGKLLHCGKSTHLWQVEIKNDLEELICIGRLTVMVIQKKSKH
ncbi:PaaI family thioesterase [Putridiphycobacter roseus]|nr:PaaI family thioesterase [Putridiphycobacter roseus]